MRQQIDVMTKLWIARMQQRRDPARQRRCDERKPTVWLERKVLKREIQPAIQSMQPAQGSRTRQAHASPQRSEVALFKRGRRRLKRLEKLHKSPQPHPLLPTQRRAVIVARLQDPDVLILQAWQKEQLPAKLKLPHDALAGTLVPDLPVKQHTQQRPSTHRQRPHPIDAAGVAVVLRPGVDLDRARHCCRSSTASQ